MVGRGGKGELFVFSICLLYTALSCSYPSSVKSAIIISPWRSTIFLWSSFLIGLRKIKTSFQNFPPAGSRKRSVAAFNPSQTCWWPFLCSPSYRLSHIPWKVLKHCHFSYCFKYCTCLSATEIDSCFEDLKWVMFLGRLFYLTAPNWDVTFDCWEILSSLWCAGIGGLFLLKLWF